MLLLGIFGAGKCVVFLGQPEILRRGGPLKSKAPGRAQYDLAEQ